MNPVRSDSSVVIAGRGIAGLSLGLRLLEQGIKPVILGSPLPPRNASRCAQGVLANKGLIFYQSPLFAAKLRSLNHVQQWLSQLEAQSGQPIPRHFNGVREPYWSPIEFQETVGRIYRRQFLGCFYAQNKSGRTWPESPFGLAKPLGYLFYPQDGWFDVEATLNAQESLLRAAGLEFLEEQLIAFEKHGEQLQLSLEKQTLQADRLVLATGVGTASLLRCLRLKEPRNFAIGGQTLEFHVPTSAPEPLTWVRGTLTASWYGHKLIVGSSSWKGDSIDEQALEADRRDLLESISRNFGWDLVSKDWISKSRRGARFRYSDRMPAVGDLEDSPWQGSVYFLNGFYKNGLHLADLCALDLVALMQGRKQDVAYPEFSPKRLFSTKSCSIQQQRGPHPL